VSRLATRDWSPLGWSSDPVPGDPDHVRSVGVLFSRTADAAEEAAGLLRRLDSADGQCSEAITLIQQQATEAATDLLHVKVRYAGAANALLTYAGSLEQSQALSLRALDVAGPAQNAQRHLNVQLTQVHTQAVASQDPQEREALISHITTLKARRDTTASHLAEARRMLQQAIEDRDSAAAVAQQEIDGAVRTSQLNDSFWDRAGNVWETARDFLDRFQEVLGWVSLAVTVVGLVLLATGVGLVLLATGVAVPLSAILLSAGTWTAVIAGGIDTLVKLSKGDLLGAAVALTLTIGPMKLLKFLRLGWAARMLGAESRAVTFHRYGKNVFRYATSSELRRIGAAKRAWIVADRGVRAAGGQQAPGMLRHTLSAARKDYARVVSKQIEMGKYRDQLVRTLLRKELPLLKDRAMDWYRDHQPQPVVVRQPCPVR
jgi:hypothetical protein